MSICKWAAKRSSFPLWEKTLWVSVAKRNGCCIQIDISGFRCGVRESISVIAPSEEEFIRTVNEFHMIRKKAGETWLKCEFKGAEKMEIFLTGYALGTAPQEVER